MIHYDICTDFELAQMVLNGDKRAFEPIVSRYKNLVYSVLLRMVNNNEEANDLAQEVFIKIYKNIGKYSDEFKFSTWTMKIATNHVIDYRRKLRIETSDIEEAKNVLDYAKSPEQEYLQKEQTAAFKNVLDKLPDMYKVPILLYHEQGLSYQEIAEIVNEPMSKVKNRIFRGRKLLKTMLEEGMDYDLRPQYE